MTTTDRGKAWRVAFLVLLALGLILLKSGQAFYAFFFLPEFHGGFGEATNEGLLDGAGWWQFTKSMPGLIIRGGAIVAFGGAWFAVSRANREQSD